MPMREAIRVVRQAFIELSAGRAAMPVRTRIDVPRASGISLHMPAYLAGGDQLATKVVSIFPKNLSRRPPLPTINASGLVFDPETGRPAGALEGGSLTALRTGAASGVATAELAPADAASAGVLGAGVQARTQLEAMLAARPTIRSASVYDPRTPAAEEFAREAEVRFGLPVRVLPDADSVVAASAVIAEATTATRPVFSDDALRNDAHLNAIGSFKPADREVPSATVARSRVFVDDRASAIFTRRFFGVGGRCRGIAARRRHAIARQQCLRLVFVNVHFYNFHRQS